MLDRTQSRPGGDESEKEEDTLRVLVVTPLGFGGRGGIDRFMDELRPIFQRLKSRRLEVEFRESRGPGNILFAPLYLASLCAAIVWSKARSRVDVVHINLSQDGSSYRKLVVAWLCRRLSIPYVLHLHGSRYRQFWDKASSLLDGALRTMFSDSAAVIVLGQVWKDYITSKIPASAATTVVILPPAAEDPGDPGNRGDRFPVQILFAGRHGARKGVWDLAEALGNLRSDDSWRATLTGDGEYEATREKIAKLGIADRVDVPGWISVEAFGRLSANSDIFILPSNDENLPLSVVEAFARRTAVIATPVGAVSDIIEDGKSGLLIKPGDVGGLTEAIRRLLHDAKLREALGARARQVYEERLNMDSNVKRLTEIWRTAKSFHRRAHG